MELGRGRWRRRWRRRRLASAARVSRLLCASFCFLFSACALLSGAASATVASETGKSQGRTRSPDQGAAAREGARWRSTSVAAERRYLVGPGSYPPRCVSKCGACNPCKPVHVPVPRGTPVITEYYPEAWRCKCGGKLYMP